MNKALLMFLSISGYSEQGIVNVFVYKWLQGIVNVFVYKWLQ